MACWWNMDYHIWLQVKFWLLYCLTTLDIKFWLVSSYFRRLCGNNLILLSGHVVQHYFQFLCSAAHCTLSSVVLQSIVLNVSWYQRQGCHRRFSCSGIVALSHDIHEVEVMVLFYCGILWKYAKSLHAPLHMKCLFASRVGLLLLWKGSLLTERKLFFHFSVPLYIKLNQCSMFHLPQV